MSGGSMHQDISEEKLIDRTKLFDLVSDTICSDTDSFGITGSILDYRIDDYARILSCEPDEDHTQYEIDFEWPEDFEEDNKSQEESRIQDSFLRAGIIQHSNLPNVMERLRMQDDVIIGIDTNVLWDCLLTSMLLDEIYKEAFPNWILVAVPKLVMAETENAANNTFGGSHSRAGDPVYAGRVAQRSLQEIMDIRQKNPDRPGLAMITVGDMNNSADINRSNWKLDSLIRNQFQAFLSDISFHKGTFFLSQDRVNVMMSGTEGADGLYLQKPDLDEFSTGTISLQELTQLLYELCIQFGSIRLVDDETDEIKTELSVLWPGKQVSDWRESMLKINRLKI